MRNVLAGIVLSLTPLAAAGAEHCVVPGGGGGCFATIREAIAAAAPAGDIIYVAPGRYFEVAIAVNKSVDIVGSGAGQTIVDGTTSPISISSVFHYPYFPPGVTSTIARMTITNGPRGIFAGRFNNVYVDNVYITGNGPLTGAGIANDSSLLYVKSSIISNNEAFNDQTFACPYGGGTGGGIASVCGGGTNIIVDSAIYGNISGRGGAGIIVSDGVLVMVNSTVSGNSVYTGIPEENGGGLLVVGASSAAYLQFNTFANNYALGGSGIVGTENVWLYGNLLQAAEFSPDVCAGPLTSFGYNLASDASCTTFVQPGDGISVDAQLQSLMPNGGPLTHALPATSPAVNRVPAANCTVITDQRGVARPQGGACDVGAYERQ